MTQPTNEKEFVEAMQREFYEIQSIEENLKELRTAAKEKGFDAAMLAKIAKARAEAKIADLVDKSQKLIDLADKVS